MEEIRQSCIRACIKSGGCSRNYTRRCSIGLSPPGGCCLPCFPFYNIITCYKLFKKLGKKWRSCKNQIDCQNCHCRMAATYKHCVFMTDCVGQPGCLLGGMKKSFVGPSSVGHGGRSRNGNRCVVLVNGHRRIGCNSVGMWFTPTGICGGDLVMVGKSRHHAQ